MLSSRRNPYQCRNVQFICAGCSLDKFSRRMSDQGTGLPPAELARLSHEAEVLEFSEPGGMMDHLAAAYGKVISVDFHPEIKVTRFQYRY